MKTWEDNSVYFHLIVLKMINTLLAILWYRLLLATEEKEHNIWGVWGGVGMGGGVGVGVGKGRGCG